MNIFQRFRFRNQMEDVAEALGGILRYVRYNDFSITGGYRDMPFSITPIRSGKDLLGLQIDIPMNNPNKKELRVLKFSNDNDWLRQHSGGSAHLQHIEHTLGGQLSLKTNDVIFSSAYLTEERKQAIAAAFAKLSEGLIFLHENELSFAIPLARIGESDMYLNCLDALCDMKQA